jgi:alkanesulfonate monooxygenase SsuD/methylene tetrahydromethanopterin reductase-like flavin-dependent oxidoreductase (luciferase family)
VAIAGTAAECRRALPRWAQAGLDSLVAVVPEAAEYAQQIERMGRDLSPAWKELRCR